MNANAIKRTAIKLGLAAVGSGAAVLIGCAILSIMILGGIVNDDYAMYGQYLILMISGMLSYFIMVKGECKKLAAMLLGVIPVLMILLLGNVILASDKVNNLFGTVAAIFSGTALLMLISLKKSNLSRSTRQHKMVNLYKKHS